MLTKVPEGVTVELVSLDGDLHAENNSKIICAGESSSLKILGGVYCRGNVLFLGSLACKFFRAENGRIQIGSLKCDSLDFHDSSLEVLSDLVCSSIFVDKKLIVRGRTESEVIDVGGVLELNGGKSRSINVGGSFRASGDVTLEEGIDVGGVVEIGGFINAKWLEVGGRAKLRGGEISGKIKVGGTFECTRPIKFGDIEVGGTVTLEGENSGTDIEVGGKIKVNGDLNFRNLEVGGTAEISGRANGATVEIGGKLTVGSSLSLTDDLEIGGHAEIKEEARARNVQIGGSFYARSLGAETAELLGRTVTDKGVFANGRIRIGRNARVEGWLRSHDTILIRSGAEVESVYASHIIIEKSAKAENLYGDNLEIEDGVVVQGEILYTQCATFRDNSASKAPRKVDTLDEKITIPTV